ncbi:uncharacterized protein LOC127653648 [Xyrauchen texanus]|uniref:uncharacterized protein LOC127653648 n=1 Tax=Xyrauchen texanus TaxID=154827 RepID=UPI002241B432|nr:uncharacterized protein LOC127653648 [Xyrauchen texanus]
MFNLLLGSDEPAITDMRDCPDQDIIDIVSLLEEPRNLTDVERYKVNDLAFSWDLPTLTTENRKWLAETILQHAVIGRREKQMKQIKRGLKDTGVLLMIKERPSLITVLFPRAVDRIILPEMVLERVIWPMTQNEDDEEDEDEDDQEVPLELKCQMASYLRMYIENATALDIEQLVTFWVGWAILPQHLYVEVSNSIKMPTAFTCTEKINLPSHYTNYMDFQADLKAAMSTSESGFGLI